MKKVHVLHQEHHQQLHLALKAAQNHGLSLAQNHAPDHDQSLHHDHDLSQDRSLVRGLRLVLNLVPDQNQSQRVQQSLIGQVQRLPNREVRRNHHQNHVLHQNHDLHHLQSHTRDHPQPHLRDPDPHQNQSLDLVHVQGPDLPAEVPVAAVVLAVPVVLKVINSFDSFSFYLVLTIVDILFSILTKSHNFCLYRLGIVNLIFLINFILLSRYYL